MIDGEFNHKDTKTRRKAKATGAFAFSVVSSCRGGSNCFTSTRPHSPLGAFVPLWLIPRRSKQKGAA